MRFAPGSGSSGGGTWGSITGTLAAQADLKTALDAKALAHAAHIYVPTGVSIQSVMDAAVVAGYNQANPCWVVPQESRTENLTMYRGIYLTGGDASGTHAPIVITGKVTISAPGGTLTINRFSIERLAIVGPSGDDALLFTGSNPQRLFLRDVWLTANGAGYCYRTNNSDATSHVIQADDLKLSHNGSGWHIYCVTGSTSFDKVETSGAVRVAYVGAGAVLNLSNSECVGTSAAGLFSVAGGAPGGTLTLTNCKLTNGNVTNPNGVVLEGSGATATCIGDVFNVPAGTGKAISGPAGSVLAFASLVFAPGTNSTIDTALTALNLNTVAALIPFAPSGSIIATDVQAAITELDTEKASAAQELWTEGIYATGWSSYDPAVSNICQYLKDSMGFVCLRGTVKYTSGGTTTIFTLPAGYRPTKRNSFATIADSNAEHINVAANGVVSLATGTGTNYVLLDGIRFDVR